MKAHLIFMLDAKTHGVDFFLGDDSELRIDAPDEVLNSAEELALIRSHKAAIQKQLETGFDWVRDGLSYADVKALTATCYHGRVEIKER